MFVRVVTIDLIIFRIEVYIRSMVVALRYQHHTAHVQCSVNNGVPQLPQTQSESFDYQSLRFTVQFIASGKHIISLTIFFWRFCSFFHLFLSSSDESEELLLLLLLPIIAYGYDHSTYKIINKFYSFELLKQQKAACTKISLFAKSRGEFYYLKKEWRRILMHQNKDMKTETAVMLQLIQYTHPTFLMYVIKKQKENRKVT